MELDLDEGSTLGHPTDRPELRSARRNGIGAATRKGPEVSGAPSPLPPRDHDARQGRTGGLEIHRLAKSFGDRPVVRDASLYVQRGEAVTLLGPEGAGKTTIIYMIIGIIPADGGRIELDGDDITGLPMYRRAQLGIGYVPQEAATFGERTVEQNIRSVLDVVEPDHRRRKDDLESLLLELEITHVRKQPSSRLSGGERRQVELARALAARPGYLLLDQPFAGVEPTTVDDIQRLIRQVTRRGIGVLITEQLNQHSRRALDISNRAYLMCLGDVLGRLTP
jgi:lipopolysaccharide export system ATP-binding protein